MDDLEKLNKALNDRGYIVFESTLAYRPGDILANPCLAKGEPIAFPFFVRAETSLADYLDQAAHVEWDVRGWKPTNRARYYRCSTD